jgi:hypothetical protein
MRWLCLFVVSAAYLFAQLTLLKLPGIFIVVSKGEPIPSGEVDFLKSNTPTAPIGVKIAFVLDPAGTRIELTEGLAAH